MSDIDVQRFSEIVTGLVVICIPTFIACRHIYISYRNARNMRRYRSPRSGMRSVGFNPIAGAFLLLRWLVSLLTRDARKSTRQVIGRGS